MTDQGVLEFVKHIAECGGHIGDGSELRESRKRRRERAEEQGSKSEQKAISSLERLKSNDGEIAPEQKSKSARHAAGVE